MGKGQELNVWQAARAPGRVLEVKASAVERGVAIELREGYQFWEDVNHHRLSARINAARRAGRIEVIRPLEITRYGTGTAVVKQLQSSSARRLKRVALGVVLLAAGAGALFMLWQVRYILALAVAGMLIFLFAVTRGGHSGACVGLHCPNCKG